MAETHRALRRLGKESGSGMNDVPQGLKSLRENFKSRHQGLKGAAEKLGTEQESQGLKPGIFPDVYGPTKVVP
jgi:hypothetical protein